MIIDKELEFSDAQAVTASAISENVVDTGALPVTKDIGEGAQLFLVIQVDTAATAAGAATVDFSVESDSTADLATSASVHTSTGPIGKAVLVAGYQVIIPLPPGDYEQYLGVRYTVATGPLTAGNFSAFMTPNPQNNKIYPDAL